MSFTDIILGKWVKIGPHAAKEEVQLQESLFLPSALVMFDAYVFLKEMTVR